MRTIVSRRFLDTCESLRSMPIRTYQAAKQKTMKIMSMFSKGEDIRPFLAEIAAFSAHREAINASPDSDVLADFARHAGKTRSSDVESADVNLYRDHILATRTPYSSMSAMRAIRVFLRYRKSLGEPCIDPSLITDSGVPLDMCGRCDMMRTMKRTTKPKVERNKELVMKRASNPDVWSWGALGNFFGMERQTAHKAFERHAPKFLSDREMAEYKRRTRRVSA